MQAPIEELRKGGTGAGGAMSLPNVDRRDGFRVTSRWSVGEAYDAYRHGPLIPEAHRRIPPGLRIDREERATDAWERL